MAQPVDDVLADLTAEYDRLNGILAGLTAEQWATESATPPWTIRDVVVHLAQTEEHVVTSLATPTSEWTTRDIALDDTIDLSVRADTADANDVLARWQVARHASVEALRRADPDVGVRWAAAPLRPRTLATTRIAEHWAHALDICDPLGIELPDTDRLRHVAWLGHATLPYAMRLDGLEPVEVHCILDAPSGDVWTFGPESSLNVITGSAGAFCRVGARRVAAGDSGLDLIGPQAGDALRLLRNYAA